MPKKHHESSEEKLRKARLAVAQASREKHRNHSPVDREDGLFCHFVAATRPRSQKTLFWDNTIDLVLSLTLSIGESQPGWRRVSMNLVEENGNWFEAKSIITVDSLIYCYENESHYRGNTNSKIIRTLAVKRARNKSIEWDPKFKKKHEEINILKYLQEKDPQLNGKQGALSRNILLMTAYYCEPSNLTSPLILTEYMIYGKLRDFLPNVGNMRIADKHLVKNGKPTRHLRLRLSMDISFGVAYLHHVGVIHRDLNLEHILIDRDMRARISSFSNAVHVGDRHKRHVPWVGLMGYSVPAKPPARILQEMREVNWQFVETEYTLLMMGAQRPTFFWDLYPLGVLLLQIWVHFTTEEVELWGSCAWVLPGDQYEEMLYRMLKEKLKETRVTLLRHAKSQGLVEVIFQLMKHSVISKKRPEYSAQAAHDVLEHIQNSLW